MKHSFHDNSTSSIIRNKAHRLCQTEGFAASDRPNVEHEMRTHLWLQAAKFNLGRGSWRSWASYILDKWCISEVRRRHAAKRSPTREECSLNDLVEDEDGRVVQRYETTPEAADHSFAHADLRHDLAALREQLPNDLILVFDLIGKGGSVHSISAELGESRREIARRHNELLRHFIDAGLRDYL